MEVFGYSYTIAKASLQMPSSGQVPAVTCKPSYKCRNELGRKESLALWCFKFIFGFKKTPNQNKKPPRRTVNWVRMVEPKEPSVYNASSTLIF